MLNVACQLVFAADTCADHRGQFERSGRLRAPARCRVGCAETPELVAVHHQLWRSPSRIEPNGDMIARMLAPSIDDALTAVVRAIGESFDLGEVWQRVADAAVALSRSTA